MIRSSIIKPIGIAALAVCSLASCKGENTGQQADSDTEVVVGDSINPTGSDGLGREIDTVEQIERSQQDTITPVP